MNDDALSNGSLARDVVPTALTNISNMALGFVSSILAARLLGPSGRGELSAILNWPSFFVTFGSLGVTAAMAYHCGRAPKEAGRIAATAGLFLAGLALPLMAIGYWLMPWLLRAQTAGTISAARVALVLVLIQFTGGLGEPVLRGLGRFRTWNAIRIQMAVLWIIVLLVCRYTSARSSALVAYGYLFAMTIHVLVWTVATLRSVSGSYRPDLTRLPALLRYGLPAGLTNVPQQLNLRLDQLLMAALLPANALGLYVVAVAWSGALSPLLSSVSQVVFPRLAATHNRQAQLEMLHRTLRLSVLTAAISGAVLLAVTPMALPRLFGSAFAPAVPVAVILIIAGVVAGLNGIAGEALRGMGLPKWPMVAEFVGLGLTIPLLVLFLKRYQLMGAAVISLISYSAVLTTLLGLITHHTRVSPRRLLVPQRQDLVGLWLKVSNVIPGLVRR